MVDENPTSQSLDEMLSPLTNGGFQFACHPGVPCFTECCRDLNLMLTPYDIIRLKNHLGLNAEDFHDRYTELRFDDRRNLSMVYLKMSDGERRPCPFVSPQGCRVYSDRPAACRIYPLARASRVHRAHGTVQEDYFVLRESHCQGFAEDRFWSVAEWTGDQGLEPYHEMNNLWMEIVTHPNLRRGMVLNNRQQQIFYLASYNLDKFRSLVLSGRFLQLFELDDQEIEAIRQDDVALLRLAYRWLRFSLFNEPVLKLRSASL